MAKVEAKIIWSVDAFSEDRELFKKIASLLKGWTQGDSHRIEPLYVLSPDQLSVPIDVFAAVKSESEKEAKIHLEKLLGKIDLPHLMNPTLLVSDNISLRSAVNVLLDYARETKADLIAVGTQSKKGMTRFLFGSFAETLVLNSDIPVLIVSPKAEKKLTVKHVLFATDLSETSRQVYRDVLEMAKRRKLHITLYNKVEYLNEYTLATVSENSLYEKYLESDIARRRKVLTEMADEARALGIKTNVVMDEKPNGATVSDSIIKAAKRNDVDFIAIASQTGPVVSAILGSVTRKVIRTAKCPVWVIHPAARSANLRKSGVLENKGAAL